MVKVTTPYWMNKPHVMYSIMDWREPRCAITIAWFLYGDKGRAEPW